MATPLGFHLGHVLVHLLQVDWDVSQLFMPQLQAYSQVAARDGFLPPCKSDTLDVLEKNLQAGWDYVED